MPIRVASGEQAGGSDRQVLMSWIRKQAETGKSIAGVVTHEVDGRKWMRILSTKEDKMLQLNEIGEEEKARMVEHKKHRTTESKSSDSVFQSSEVAKAALEFDRPVCTVGPYVFDEAVLQRGREELLAAAEEGVDILVVDEVGPLEVKKGMGLEPAFRRSLEGRDRTLIVVIVRPNLWDFFREHYRCSEDVLQMDF